jgi:exonuclease SbcD
MRILHTSDWHLGRSFHRAGLLDAQAAWFDHLVEVVRAEAVDLVVVAGDVYDRALPQVDAVLLLEDALARLADARVRVVLTSGNHDSGPRLGFGSRLMDAAGVHLRTQADAADVPVLVEDQHGTVAVYGIPFLDPGLLQEPWGLRGRSHEAALTEATARIRADLAGRRGARSVVLAHAFVAGCRPSESERDISVGGVSMVSAEVFEGFSYTALGHLHSPQVLGETLRYSGSPLAYSFSEADQAKGSWLVDLGRTGVERLELIPAPVPRRLGRVRGRLADLLTDPALAEHESSWLQVTLTDDLRPERAMDRLLERFPHALALLFEPTHPPVATTPMARATGRSDHQIALDFVSAVRGVPADGGESALLQAAVESCCGGD